MIEVADLHKRYGKNPALRGVSFQVDGGSVYGLLGPNGAGKTTTLRILATLVRPDDGTARVAGHDVISHPLAVRARLGIVNGGMGLYERLTGREILGFFGRFYGLEGRRLEEGIAWVDEVLGIGDALDRRVGDMSSGMIQKVIVARAIIHKPPVLLLDEATRGLDVFARRALLDFVDDYRRQGKAIVYSTHVLPEAEEICDRVGFLYEGRLLFEGSLDEAKRRWGTDSLERAFIRAAEEVRV
ncbi:ABC transporter ATP-binding protein [Oceanithermus sp.]